MSAPRGTGAAGGRLAKALLSLVALLFCTAPVPGDVGGCGQEPQQLDPPIFFATKLYIDCDRCKQCGIETVSCELACDESTPIPDEFPEGCVPLVHDGEVCLRALRHASCSDYRSYMAELGPSVPTECNFCPEQP